MLVLSYSEVYTPSRQLKCPQTAHNYLVCDSCVCTKCAKTSCRRKEHIPNFCISLQIYENCKDEAIVQLDPTTTQHVWKKTKYWVSGGRCERCVGKVPCEGCCIREKLFVSPHTAEEFIGYILDLKHKGISALAHNLGNYDGYFSLKHPLKPDVVFSNGKS